MYKIDVLQLLADKGLELATVAKVLFPKNQYPAEALERLAEKGELRESQIIALCKLTGEDPTSLFSRGWKGKVGEGVLIFSRGRFKAVFNPATRVTSIFKDGRTSELVHEFVVLGESVAISDYVATLDLEVTKLN